MVRWKPSRAGRRRASHVYVWRSDCVSCFTGSCIFINRNVTVPQEWMKIEFYMEWKMPHVGGFFFSIFRYTLFLFSTNFDRYILGDSRNRLDITKKFSLSYFMFIQLHCSQCRKFNQFCCVYSCCVYNYIFIYCIHSQLQCISSLLSLNSPRLGSSVTRLHEWYANM